MEKELLFEGIQLEILTKEDINLEFEGSVLFNGKQVSKILGYADNCSNEESIRVNLVKAISCHVENENKYIITKDMFRNQISYENYSIGKRGEIFISEDGAFDLIYNSHLPKAKEFRKKVKEIIKTVQKTGKFDSIENKLLQIEDEKERQLRLTLKQLEDLLKIDSSNFLTVINYNQTKMELESYMQKQELVKLSEEISSVKKVAKLAEEKIDNIKDIIIINPGAEWRKETNLLVARICSKGNNYQKTKNEIYKTLEEKAGCSLSTRLTNLKKRATNNGMQPSKIKGLNNLDVIANDVKLKTIYIAIVKEFAIKSGIYMRNCG